MHYLYKDYILFKDDNKYVDNTVRLLQYLVGKTFLEVCEIIFEVTRIQATTSLEDICTQIIMFKANCNYFYCS